jgi:hypothetical protein
LGYRDLRGRFGLRNQRLGARLPLQRRRAARVASLGNIHGDGSHLRNGVRSSATFQGGARSLHWLGVLSVSLAVLLVDVASRHWLNAMDVERVAGAVIGGIAAGSFYAGPDTHVQRNDRCSAPVRISSRLWHRNQTLESFH